MIEIIKKDFELEDHGIIYLNGKINPEMYEYVSREIIRHNCKGKQKFIQMIINSPGGYLTDGFAIIDTMKWSEIPIHTYAIGEACSAAFLIFIAGKPFSRTATKIHIFLLLFAQHKKIARSDKDILERALRIANAKPFFFGEQ